MAASATKTTTKPKKADDAALANPNLLSEEEVLKMSDKDYMNEDQLAFFKARLQHMEHELLANADQTVEHLHDNVIVPDPADRATIEEEHALELRTRDRERKLIKKIDESLQNLERGDYGFCETCGIEIGIRRLEARPTATQCIDCKTLDELRERQVG